MVAVLASAGSSPPAGLIRRWRLPSSNARAGGSREGSLHLRTGETRLPVRILYAEFGRLDATRGERVDDKVRCVADFGGEVFHGADEDGEDGAVVDAGDRAGGVVGGEVRDLPRPCLPR